MTVQEICAAVRWCYDEEELNETNFAPAQPNDNANNDNSLMNNIIKAKIGDAMRWICLYAPAELFSGVSSSGSDVCVDAIVEETDMSVGAGTKILSPQENMLRVIRVRGSAWKRAILGDSLINEDSDEYLQLSDENGATATNDRPQAALINTKKKKVEVWPAEGTFTLTYVRALTSDDMEDLDEDDTEVALPTMLEASFIYYLAFLVLSAYEDSRAARMLEIAKMNVSRTENTQNK